MGALELNEGLAAASAQKGEPSRNPTGWNNVAQRTRNREIRELMRKGGAAPCNEPGYEHLSLLEYVFGVLLWQMAKERSKFAITTLANRIYGRVPHTLEMELQAIALRDQRQAELHDMTDDEVVARFEALRAQADALRVIDVDPSAPERPADAEVLAESDVEGQG